MMTFFFLSATAASQEHRDEHSRVATARKRLECVEMNFGRGAVPIGLSVLWGVWFVFSIKRRWTVETIVMKDDSGRACVQARLQ